jgi:hypothetical protein
MAATARRAVDIAETTGQRNRSRHQAGEASFTARARPTGSMGLALIRRLESGGVEFIEEKGGGSGVRLRKRPGTHC